MNALTIKIYNVLNRRNARTILRLALLMLCILYFVINALDSSDFWYAHFSKLGMNRSLEYWFLTLGSFSLKTLEISFWRESGGFLYSFAQTFPGCVFGGLCLLALRFRKRDGSWGARFFAGYVAYFALRGVIGSLMGRISVSTLFSLMPALVAMLVAWYCYSHSGEEHIPIIGALISVVFGIVSIFSTSIPLSQAIWYFCMALSFTQCISIMDRTSYEITQYESQQSPLLTVLVIIAFSAFNWLTGDALLDGGSFSYPSYNSSSYSEYDRHYDREEIWDFMDSYGGW